MMASHRYNYFNELVQMTTYSCQAAQYLDKVVNAYDPSSLLKNVAEMHEIEHEADEKRHEIMKNLVKEFLPPIEREDIVELASKIDDITDCIDDVMQHFYIYDIKSLIPECKAFSNLIVRCCESIQHTAREFCHFRKSTTILESMINTNHLESEGDRLYSEIMHRVFTSDMPDKELFIWARIVASLEDCCDFCEEVSEQFESAMMKNS